MIFKSYICIYLLPVLALALSVCTAFKQQTYETNVWQKNQRVKRQGWPMAMQNDGQASQQQQQPLVGAVQPYRLAMCEPEISTVGKRSLQGLDSFPTLSHYFMNEETSDVKLVVNGTRYPGHKFVLMAKSPVLAAMFREDPLKQEFDLGIDSSEDDFKVMLKYFYTEKLSLEGDVDYQRAVDIYKLAQQYAVEGLKMQIERHLAKMIHLSNYLDIYKFANENQMHELTRLWMGFVFSNSAQIIADDRFMNESVNIAEKVLTALNAPSSYVITQIKKLLEANPGLDVQHFRYVVHLERCSVDDLLVLAEMKMFDEKYLFDDMVKRYRVLAANCAPRPVVRHVHQSPHQRNPWLPNQV